MGSPDGLPTVVVLTALDLEFLAVRRHLIDLAVRQHPAGTLFEVGTLAGGAVRVALVATGVGNAAAAVIAERAIAMFRPRAVLFVGVAGALKDDLALGDVVVATKVYAYHGGKDTADGFLARPDAWAAPYELEEIARHLARTGTWTHALPADDRAARVTVHLKPVAAGEVVLNSRTTPLAEQLHRQYNDAVAIEMESAGAARAGQFNAQPVLTVRGISDRADGHKYAADAGGSQPLAASRAAAFAMALVAHLPAPDAGPAADRQVERMAERLAQSQAAAIEVGLAGRPAEAARLLRGVLADRERLVGAAHPETLLAKYHVAVWTGRTGERAEAARLLREVVADQARTLPAAHPDLLRSRTYLAYNTGLAGDPAAGRRQLAQVLAAQGPDADPEDVLDARCLLADLEDPADPAGPAATAAALRAVAEDAERSLGAGHRLTLDVRRGLASVLVRSGERAGARRVLDGLVAGHATRLGPDHPATLACRYLLARATDDPALAERLFRDLLDDQIRVLGPADDATLDTRFDLANAAPDAGERLRRLDALIPELARLAGPDHPQTLLARRMLAATVADGGQHAEALRLCADLLPDHVRVLGAHHRATLVVRQIMADLTAGTGDLDGAVALSRAVLADLVRAFGADHPDVAETREMLRRHEAAARRG